MSSWETMLPDTAKALSAPLTKLIKVVGDGCGKVYEPTGIRRRAHAEADALVIMEEARSRVSEIAARAAQRLLDVEERRQQNIESVTAQAADLLPNEVSEEPVDPDWAARFFSECQDVGNEQMQAVWARLLAGEVAKPGTFSPRTLWVLKNLTAAEAQHFNILCKNSFRSHPRGDYYPLVGVGDKDYWLKLELSFVALQRLENAGLINNHPLGIRVPSTTQGFLWGSKTSLDIRSDTPAALPLGEVSFTVAGIELALICEWDIPAARVADVLAAIKAPFKAIPIEVLEELPTGVLKIKVMDSEVQ